MLTREKLKRFEEFGGDVDGWARMRPANNDSFMTVEDWNLIDRLVMNLGIVQSGIASGHFIAETETMLHENTADESTRDALRMLAAQLTRMNQR